MSPSEQQKKEATSANYGYPGDLWYAMARLRAAHLEPVGHSVPFERPSALLSITEPDDLVLAARVGLSGTETMGHLHDLIDTVTRDLAGGSRIGDFALVARFAERWGTRYTARGKIIWAEQLLHGPAAVSEGATADTLLDQWDDTW